MHIEVYKDKALEWRWRAVADNGKTIADSGEGYHNKADMMNTLDSIKKLFSEGTEIRDLILEKK